MVPEHTLSMSIPEVIQGELQRANIPFSKDLFEGLSESVAQDLLEVLQVDTAALSFFLGEADLVRADAIEAGSPHQNELIAEFVAYEPFRHIGIIKEGIALRAGQNNNKFTEEEEKKFGELVNYHLLAARIAIETFNAFSENGDPVELWNYYEMMITNLLEEINEHQENPEFVNFVVEDIALYKELQDRIILT